LFVSVRGSLKPSPDSLAVSMGGGRRRGKMREEIMIGTEGRKGKNGQPINAK